MVPGVVEGGGDHGERDARSVRLATRLLAGLRAKPPGIAAGSGLVLYFCVAVIMHVRAGAFRVIRVPAAYLGLSSMSFALATRRATRPPTA
jgi:phage shock protein PspC (stress-responsive transcriptional regulator)